MQHWFEPVTIEKLSLFGAFQNIEVSSVALLFNLLLLMIIEVQRFRQKQGESVLAFVVASVMCANAVTCVYVFLAYADIGIPDVVICLLQSAALLCNAIVCYMFCAYVLRFVNYTINESVKMPGINRFLLVVDAAVIAGWLVFAVPHILHEGTLVKPAGLLYVLIGFGIEVYYMIYALFLIVRRRTMMGSRAFMAVVCTFLLTIVSVLLQAYLGRAPVINYLGATFGLFVFYFSAETPDYIRLTRTLEELTVERGRAEAANRAKSEFLANMSHEMRTPLNAVLGMNEMILRESRDAAITEYARDVERAGRSLLSVINDVLDFSRIESGKLKIVSAPYNLSAVINDVYNMTLFRAEQNRLVFRVEVDPEIPDQLTGDEIRIRQIMTNLLNNAIKYTREGSVTLTVGWKRPGNPSAIELVITVQDTGIGIRPEDMEKLFGKFERFDMERNNSIEGTGLGLAITHEIVTLMNGRIQADSAYGEGSVFEVRIPQEVAGTEPIGDFRETFRKAQQVQVQGSTRFLAPEANVLIVDDTSVNLSVFRKLLGRTRMMIDAALSGLDALALTQDIPYDLIFLDQRMPGMDGEQTLSHIRSQADGANKETPVVCLTADAVSGARDKYLEKGFTDYLSKPVDPEALEETVMRYLPREKVLPPDAHETAVRNTAEAEETGMRETLPAAPGGIPDEKEMRIFFDRSGMLSYRTAIKNCADAETLFIILQEYCSEITENCRLLDAYAQEGDTERYTIKVHALKSASRMIGALELAEAAYRLEQAGDEGRTDDIRKQTPELLAAYRALGETLRPLMGDNA